MDVYGTGAGAVQALVGDELEYLRVLGDRSGRKSVQEIEYFFAAGQIAAGEFLDYKGMQEDRAFIE